MNENLQYVQEEAQILKVFIPPAAKFASLLYYFEKIATGLVQLQPDLPNIDEHKYKDVENILNILPKIAKKFDAYPPSF